MQAPSFPLRRHGIKTGWPDAYGICGSFTVNASDSSCPWTASKTDTWITLIVGSGTGTGPVGYVVMTNSGAPRNGNITAAGKIYTVSQAGTSCKQVCEAQKQTCESSGDAMCPDYCQNQVYSNPTCQSNPMACPSMYSICMSSCSSMIQSSCNIQYNQCMTGCN